MQHKDEAELIARSLDGDHLAYVELNPLKTISLQTHVERQCIVTAT